MKVKAEFSEKPFANTFYYENLLKRGKGLHSIGTLLNLDYEHSYIL